MCKIIERPFLRTFKLLSFYLPLQPENEKKKTYMLLFGVQDKKKGTNKNVIIKKNENLHRQLIPMGQSQTQKLKLNQIRTTYQKIFTENET